MNDPDLEHVLRAVPPWRTGPLLTECGLLADGKPVLTRDAFVAKVKAQGQKRSAMTTCMTCWSTAASHPAVWDTDPVGVMYRDTGHARHAARYAAAGSADRAPAAVMRVRDEMLAIAELIGRHRDEFDAILGGLGETVRLGDRRRKIRRA
jgi:hypothetical protein